MKNNFKKRFEAFKNEVQKGLTAYPKHLNSKFIYDKNGDRLFQDIMAMPEYYLTDAEMEIIATNKITIGELFRDKENGLDLIELGAGDGKKTKVLLKHMAENQFNFTYKPVDISENAVFSLTKTLAEELPDLETEPIVGEYFDALERIQHLNKRKKVILFLGSNIGNMEHAQAIDFLSKLNELMNEDDLLFLGMDQKKDPEIILNAYNDKTGITAAFNKNILERINSELDANFDVSKFKHWETYNPESGTAKSYLLATEPMEIYIEAIPLKVSLAAWESIHIEISQKYDDASAAEIAGLSNFEIAETFTDSKDYYKNYVFKRMGSF
ncbi:MAG: L-histidine N(alpha)-methyltransferase [Bacteroidetes bacterium]|nr:L-histidine N(alpha)-methyltransferase [Bacteroidota bacterium]